MALSLFPIPGNTDENENGQPNRWKPEQSGKPTGVRFRSSRYLLWFRSPRCELATGMMRTSDPPHESGFQLIRVMRFGTAGEIGLFARK
jgi:hypothetical protein